MKDNLAMPALVLIGVGLVLFVACLVGFATGNAGVGLVLAALAAIGLVGGAVWLAVEHRRVRGVEDRWYADHPGIARQRYSG